MACHMEHTCTGIIFIPSFEVETRVNCHIGSGHLYIFVVGNIDTCRIVHLIISARSDGEAGYGTLSVVEDRIDIGREYTLIIIVYCDSGIRPPQEGLRHLCTVIKHSFYFKKACPGRRVKPAMPFWWNMRSISLTHTVTLPSACSSMVVSTGI